MGKPPIPVAINMAASVIGIIVCVIGFFVARKPLIGWSGSSITFLAFISSLITYHRITSERRKAMRALADSIERCIK